MCAQRPIVFFIVGEWIVDDLRWTESRLLEKDFIDLSLNTLSKVVGYISFDLFYYKTVICPSYEKRYSIISINGG